MVLNDFMDYLVIVQKIHYGRQLIYRFGDYGLSILEEPIGDGPIYNSAVIKFKGANHIYDVVSKDVVSDDENKIVELLMALRKLDKQKVI